MFNKRRNEGHNLHKKKEWWKREEIPNKIGLGQFPLEIEEGERGRAWEVLGWDWEERLLKGIPHVGLMDLFHQESHSDFPKKKLQVLDQRTFDFGSYLEAR